jgi:guanylate cyclase
MQLTYGNLLNYIVRIAGDPDDTDEHRLRKSLLVGGSMMLVLAGSLWGTAYIVLGEPLAGIIPWIYSLLAAVNLIIFNFTRKYNVFLTSQLLLILLLPFFLMVALGGFINSSAVILWSLLAPFGSLIFASVRRPVHWLLAYLTLLLLSGYLQPFVRAANNLPQYYLITFFILNIAAVSIIAFTLLYYFVGRTNRAMSLLRVEQEKSDRLLLNLLPKEVGQRLKDGASIIADQYDSASVMFADMVDFTRLSIEIPPKDMVELLSTIYSSFDTMVERYGVEKIRTIGDNYMVAAGIPKGMLNHAQVLARLALEMNAFVNKLAAERGMNLSFRFGINSGSLIAGVIGHQKFHYDVWGDAVNTASRMESQGEPGRIQITQNTYELVKDYFDCERHGCIEVKGKGPMDTWYLTGEKQANG